MRSKALHGLWALLAAGPAVAQTTAAPTAPPPDPPPVEWRVKPTSEQIAAVFPAGAQAKKLSGAASMLCALKAGALADCRVRGQWPAGEGFGEAALKLAPLYRSDGPDQLAIVRVEWRQPFFDRAEAAARGGDLSLLEVIPPAQLVWARTPTAETMARSYPPKAAAEGVGGSADLLCFIGLRGLPESCKVIEESPPGLGFGAAAQRGVAPAMQAAPLARDGLPSQGRVVRIRIAFEPAAPAAPAAPAPAPATAPAAAPPPVRPAAPAAPSLKDVPWAGGPTPEQLDRAFPKAAREAGVSGRSSITCKVKATGELEACKVESEFPTAAGFGAAALSVAPLFKLKPTTAEGRSLAGASITIPLVWKAPGRPVIRVVPSAIDPRAGEYTPATTTKPAEP